jgi:tetratricopeptide (TPR) repeat protein
MHLRMSIVTAALLAMILGCGGGPEKKFVVEPPAPKIGKPVDATPVANKSPTSVDYNDFRVAAEMLEEEARKFDKVGKNYSRNMTDAALAWQRAGDKSRALAAAKSAIAAGADDQSPLETCLWHTKIGDVLLFAGETPLAIEHYEAALKVSPNPISTALAQKKLDEAKGKSGKGN